MTTMVRFRAPGGQFALPVANVSEVRTAAGMSQMPEPRPGIVGLMDHAGSAVPVLSLLGVTGGHVVIVEDGPVRFGLLVEQVVGVDDMSDVAVQPPPDGQDSAVIGGVLSDELGLVQLLDLSVLTGRVTGG